jgi:hypothetical protein
MGTLYRKRCDTCDDGPEPSVTFEGFSGATITNATRGGEIITDGYLAYITEDGDLVPLPHPLEEETLHKHGGTWRDATLHGRLLHVHNLLCLDCGAPNTSASLSTFTGTGCLAGLCLAVVMIIANIYLIDLHGLIEYLLVWLVAFVPSMIVAIYVRIRYTTNTKPFLFQKCTDCGGHRVVSVRRAMKRAMVCRRCGNRSVTVEIAGRS